MILRKHARALLLLLSALPLAATHAPHAAPVPLTVASAWASSVSHARTHPFDAPGPPPPQLAPAVRDPQLQPELLEDLDRLFASAEATSPADDIDLDPDESPEPTHISDDPPRSPTSNAVIPPRQNLDAPGVPVIVGPVEQPPPSAPPSSPSAPTVSAPDVASGPPAAPVVVSEPTVASAQLPTPAPTAVPPPSVPVSTPAASAPVPEPTQAPAVISTPSSGAPVQDPVVILPTQAASEPTPDLVAPAPSVVPAPTVPAAIPPPATDLPADPTPTAVVAIPPGTIAPVQTPGAVPVPTAIAPTSATPEIVAPTPVAPTPIAPTPIAPTPIAPASVAPTPVAPEPIGPAPVAPTPVAPVPTALAPVATPPTLPSVVPTAAPAQPDPTTASTPAPVPPVASVTPQPSAPTVIAPGTPQPPAPTAVPPPASSTPLPTGTIGPVPAQPSDITDGTFTCLYFGSGTVPTFGTPDPNAFTGDVSIFTVSPNEFPGLASQYLSHTHASTWSYSFAVDTDGVYEVVLGFAEIFDKACAAPADSGFRVFTAAIGDQSSTIDVIATVGCGVPVQQLFKDVVPDSGVITVAFQGVTQQAMLSTLCHRKLPDVASVPTPSVVPSTAAPAPIPTAIVEPTTPPSTTVTSAPIPTAIIQPTTAPTTAVAPPQPLPGPSTPAVSTAAGPTTGFTCVNFGPSVGNGYFPYDVNAVVGDTKVYEGVKFGDFPTLSAPYRFHLFGKAWSYSLDVATSQTQNVVLGFAEVFPGACEAGPDSNFRVFSVSVEESTQDVDVFKSVGCGTIHQISFDNVTPVNGIIDISLTAVADNAMLSVVCYMDAVGTASGLGASEPVVNVLPPTLAESNIETADDGDSGVSDPRATDQRDINTDCFKFGGSFVPGFSTASLPGGSTVQLYNGPSSEIAGTSLDSVYNSHIFGSEFTLSFNVADPSAKSVVLGFAEVYKPACQEDFRVFKVDVGSQSRTIDVYKEAGCKAILQLELENIVPSTDGNIQVRFSSMKKKNSAMVSSVCVLNKNGVRNADTSLSISAPGVPETSATNGNSGSDEAPDAVILPLGGSPSEDQSAPSPHVVPNESSSTSSPLPDGDSGEDVDILSPVPPRTEPAPTGLAIVPNELESNGAQDEVDTVFVGGRPGQTTVPLPTSTPLPKENGVIVSLPDEVTTQAPPVSPSETSAGPSNEENVLVNPGITFLESGEGQTQEPAPTESADTSVTPSTPPAEFAAVSSDSPSMTPSIAPSESSPAATTDILVEPEISVGTEVPVSTADATEEPLSTADATEAPLSTADATEAPLSMADADVSQPTPEGASSSISPEPSDPPSPSVAPTVTPEVGISAEPTQPINTAISILPDGAESTPIGVVEADQLSNVTSEPEVLPTAIIPFQESPTEGELEDTSETPVASPLAVLIATTSQATPTPEVGADAETLMASPLANPEATATPGVETVTAMSTPLASTGGEQRSPSPFDDMETPTPSESQLVTAILPGSPVRPTVTPSLAPRDTGTFSPTPIASEQPTGRPTGDSGFTVTVTINGDTVTPPQPTSNPNPLADSESGPGVPDVTTATTAPNPSGGDVVLSLPDESQDVDGDGNVTTLPSQQQVGASPSALGTPVIEAIPPPTTPTVAPVPPTITPSPGAPVASASPIPSAGGSPDLELQDTPTVTPTPVAGEPAVPSGVVIGPESSASPAPGVPTIPLPNLSNSPSPSPVVSSVTGATDVIVINPSMAPSATPQASMVAVAPPGEVVSVPESETDVIDVPQSNEPSEDGSVVVDVPDGAENAEANGAEGSIVDGDLNASISTAANSRGFAVGMGILGTLLVLLLLVCLFFAIFRSGGGTYTYSSQYSAHRPTDYDPSSQAAYTDELLPETAEFGGDGGFAYGNEGSGAYPGGGGAKNTFESRPPTQGESFGYGSRSGGAPSGSAYEGNTEPDKFAAYGSMNVGDQAGTYVESQGPTTGDYTFNDTFTMPETTGFAAGARGAGYDDTDRRDSATRSHTAGPQTIDSFTEYRPEAQPVSRSALGGKQERGPGYQVTPPDSPTVFSDPQEHGRKDSRPNDVHLNAGLDRAAAMEQFDNVAVMAVATGDGYSRSGTDQQYVSSGMQEDSGNVASANHPTSEPQSAEASYAPGPREEVASERPGTELSDSYYNDDVRNTGLQADADVAGVIEGRLGVPSQISNDGPWPQWWSKSKDNIAAGNQVHEDVHGDQVMYGSPRESGDQSDSKENEPHLNLYGLSAVLNRPSLADNDAHVVRKQEPSANAGSGVTLEGQNLPMTLSQVDSHWIQNSKTSLPRGEYPVEFEGAGDDAFAELRKRREPYVRSVASRLSVRDPSVAY